MAAPKPRPYTGAKDFDASLARITVEHMDHLDAHGYAILDGFLGREWASALRDEIKWLHDSKLTFPNQVRFLDPNGAHVTVTKPYIHELDLHHGDRRGQCPELDLLFSQAHVLAEHCNTLKPELALSTKPESHTLKVQYNEGGGAFPWHHDNPGRPDKRRLSCLLYLNPDWTDGDGGEIRLASFLQPPVTVEPLFDRLVMFFSESMLHRVTPAQKPRHCLTIWLDSPVANEDSCALPWPGMQGQIDGSFAVYGKPTVQRKLARSVYAEEYEKSIRDCMQDDPEGLQLLLTSHHQHLDTMRQNQALWAVVEQLRLLKAPLEADQ